MSDKRSVDRLTRDATAVEIGLKMLQQVVEGYASEQAAIDKQAADLKPEVVEHKRVEAREKFGAKAEAMYEKHIQSYRDIPTEQKALYDPAQLRRTSRFHADDATDAQMTTALLGRLAIAPPQRLAEMAQDIAQNGDFAKAGLLKDFVSSRGDSLPLDVQGAVEKSLGEMQYQGPEVEQLNELELLLFEAEQVVNLVKTGGRKFTSKQLEQMSQTEFEDAWNARERSGSRQ